jgi:hypothetical protein
MQAAVTQAQFHPSDDQLLFGVGTRCATVFTTVGVVRCFFRLFSFAMLWTGRTQAQRRKEHGRSWTSRNVIDPNLEAGSPRPADLSKWE